MKLFVSFVICACHRKMLEIIISSLNEFQVPGYQSGANVQPNMHYHTDSFVYLHILHVSQTYTYAILLKYLF